MPPDRLACRYRLAIAAVLALGVGLAPVTAWSATPSSAIDEARATPVRVERVRPAREALPTLRFLKENRAFLRARYDLLRGKPGARRGGAGSIDPRFLAYQAMLAEVRAADDSVAAADSARGRRTLFGSVTELGELEARLDALGRMLAAQQARLATLQQDFAGLQRTALAIVLTGAADAPDYSAVALHLDDGATLSIPLTDEQRTGLRHGAVLELFHGLVEPREQVIEVSLVGTRADAPADSGFVTLEPARDRLTFLRLHAPSGRALPGSAGLVASRWVVDAAPAVREGSETGP